MFHKCDSPVSKLKIMYFYHIAAIEASYRWTYVKFMKRVWAPLLMKVQQYDVSNAVMWSKYMNNLWFLRGIATNISVIHIPLGPNMFGQLT